MVSQFIRLRFKNAAQTVQTFTMFGASTNSMYFDSYEIQGIELTEPQGPEVSTTVEGFAASVIKTMGRKASFSVILDTPQTLEKFDRLSSFVNTDRFVVGLTVMQGNFIWNSSLDNYGLQAISSEMNCVLEFAPLKTRNIMYGRSLQSTTIPFVAHETAFFPLPNAGDVIAAAPSGGGN